LFFVRQFAREFCPRELMRRAVRGVIKFPQGQQPPEARRFPFVRAVAAHIRRHAQPLHPALRRPQTAIVHRRRDVLQTVH